MTKKKEYLTITNAGENNLKDISLSIPHDTFIGVSGISGSGKSSLVFDTIAREGMRRMIQAFSAHTRQFMSRFPAPKVDMITGLRPVLVVDQKSVIKNPRSTVGTLSELFDLLRLLFARFSTAKNALSHDKKPSRSSFSFNTPEGACIQCKGLGVTDEIVVDLLIADPKRSLREGAFSITSPNGYIMYSQVTLEVLNKVCNAHGFSIDIPWNKLSKEEKDIVLYGSDIITVPYGKHSLESRMKWTGITIKPREEGYYKGILPVMQEILNRDRNKNILKYAQTILCDSCQGGRLKHEALQYFFNDHNIDDFHRMTIETINEYFNTLNTDNKGVQEIAEKISGKCKVLQELGLGYLTLNRGSTSLSGGEAQRIRLANQITNRLSGLLYILDEPSIGLHPADQEKMINALDRLVTNGNTLMVVEHEKKLLLRSNYLIDIGPEAGVNGGEVLFNNYHDKTNDTPTNNNHTFRYLYSTSPPQPKTTIRPGSNYIRIEGAGINNLKDITVTFKRKAFNVVCGVAGAGKSTLVHHVLADNVKKKSRPVDRHGSPSLTGIDDIEKVIDINQSPIGKSSRSNPATYTKVMDHIRKLMAGLPEAKERGYTASYFSFNNKKGGRCPVCEGNGVLIEGFHFLGTFERECKACNGKRYTPEALSIQFHGKGMDDILLMSIDEASSFFKEEQRISEILHTLQALGLGYLTLGQRTSTLSGGEAQRIKLASELSKQSASHTLYTLDEPSTGLHDHDLNKLLKILNLLTDQGHTVVVTEHHQDVILQADHIIELGPGSGDEGGEVVFSGTPVDLLSCKTSITAKHIINTTLQKVTPFNPPLLSEEKSQYIRLQGVNTNNLRNISANIPVNQITMVTGESGSGKSSLVMDTLYAEGWQRYIENFSSYARSHMQSRNRANADTIEGLHAAIAIGRTGASASKRSTLATYTGILDYLRLIFSRGGVPDGDQYSASCFSFNHPEGACPHCTGLGFTLQCDPDKLIGFPDKPIAGGAMENTKTGIFYGDPHGKFMAALFAAGKSENISYDLPYHDLSKSAKEIALYGLPGKTLDITWHYQRKNRAGTHSFREEWKGLVPIITEVYLRKTGSDKKTDLHRLMTETQCSKCHGKRYKGEILLIKYHDYSIADLLNMSVKELFYFTAQTTIKEQNEGIRTALTAVHERCKNLITAGLEYLTLDRFTGTLSGGELQRTGIAIQALSGMESLLCLLDEPGRSLHPKNKKGVITLIKALKENNNTVVMIEHDISFLEHADHVIEMGPGGGKNGGQIVYQGDGKAITKKYNREITTITKKFIKRSMFKEYIEFHHLTSNNLSIDHISIPKGAITIISGVSGSGKSSLLNNTIAGSVSSGKPIHCTMASGLPKADQLLHMAQSTATKQRNSTPLTITGLWEPIKRVFSLQALPEYPTAAPLNLKGKAALCTNCHGIGTTHMEMDFLSDIEMTCESCHGLRYHPDVLNYRMKGLNLGEIMQLTFSEAITFFSEDKSLFEQLHLFSSVGLSYLTLGQQGNHLSSGEIQRLQLLGVLLKSQKKQALSHLIILDEPSAGLHYRDTAKVYGLLQQLRDAGHTIIASEHHPVFTQLADYSIVLGPGAGPDGGKIVYAGITGHFSVSR